MELRIGTLDSERLACERRTRIPVLKNCVTKTPILMDLIWAERVSSPILEMSTIRRPLRIQLIKLITTEMEEPMPLLT